ncbi:MAG: TonB-dependent receptor [Pseudomonadales bacterium]|nr:TonB-dependent receptor [Pseudomonadales bacterium]
MTAERKESSVQDTSISITAFTSEMIDDFGIKNQSDLQNMVPATTIQPYDSAIRGVGRNFRNLGGDPGVATYMNGVYSEDLYTVTIGSLWDIERIEILRGPQGTLYGRNAVGGAMNFIYKRPTDTFEFSAKTTIGDYGTRDVYGVISGPLIEGKLNGRLTASKRKHDGWVEEKSGLGPDLDSGDEQNVALQLEWNITDNLTANLRSNQANVDRVMGGANGGGLIVLTGENVYGDQLRDFTRYSESLRAVDPAEMNPLSSAFVDPTQPIINFTNPTTGTTIQGQYVRPGVDPASSVINYGRGLTYSNSDCVFLDRSDIKGSDLCAYTNGLNNEKFDQQGNQLEFAWDLANGWQVKYIVGYNSLLYERTTDDDSVASTTEDRQFYLNHEAEYLSNELQLFWDLGDNLSFTSGVFYYNSTIDQRYDFYSSTGSNKYTNPAFALDTILATVAPGAVPGNPPLTYLAGATPVDVNSAKEAAIAANAPVGSFTIATGPWLGDATLGSVPHGPTTLGSDTHSLNKTVRDAFAIYTQGVWDINDKFTLTLGLRYAEDDVTGEEQLAQYAETESILDALGLNLATVNILRGAVSPTTLQLTGAVEPWIGGVPITFGAYRELHRKDKKLTWRVNLDYNLTDNVLVYGNVTTGYRSGGFNLAFFSQTPQYEPEELTAYELGMKGQFLDNTLQANASVYFYDYSSIHTYTEEACPAVPTPQSMQSACAVSESTTSVQAAPGAEVKGFELELLWLATDNLTVGGNYSFTDSKYSKSFIIVDGADPTTPGQIYDATNEYQRARDINGNQLLQVPKNKATAYASYRFPLGDNGDLNLLGNWSYIDDVYFSAYESQLDLAPSYDRVDLRATWTSPRQSWVVSAFCNNVFDEIGIRQIERRGVADGYRRNAQVTEPRFYGVEVTYSMQ